MSLPRFFFIGGVVIAYAAQASAVAPEKFPIKPIRLVVYTKPGGSIDTTARKFVDVAAKFTDATFVVENRPGSGGIVAIKDVLQSKADGYTLLACTKSNVAVLAATGDASLVHSFDWLTMLMADPECVITRRDTGPSTWSELVDDARNKSGRQIWVGPSYGGLDHVMAMKTWEKSGIQAVWVPFQSGGNALTELLGGRCVAYVGNPSEMRTNPDNLRVAAVSGRERLRTFPDAPTFRELGVAGLEDEIMWRGFAVRKGVPPAALAWYEELFRKVSADEGWRAFYEKDGIDVGFRDTETFTATVMRDHQDFTTYLGQLGILRFDVPAPFSRFVSGWYPLLVVAMLALGCWLMLRFAVGATSGNDVGEALIPIVLIFFGGWMYLATLVFPQVDDVGAAAIPRLWLAVLLPLSLVLCGQAWRSLRTPAEPALQVAAHPATSDTNSPVAVRQFGWLLLAYVPVMIWLGYIFSTFLFLPVAMILLGERNLRRVVGVTVGWLAFSYVVFVRLLFVPLPTGLLWERLF